MEQYTIIRLVPAGNKSSLEFIDYHETHIDETLSEMIKRKKIKNISRIFKGYVEEVEDW